MIVRGKSPLLRIAVLAASLAFPAMAAEPTAPSWPQFRGPTGQGLADGTGPRKWTRDAGIAWKVELPAHGWSSPVIAAGKMALTGARKDGDKTILSAFALDTHTTPTTRDRDDSLLLNGAMTLPAGLGTYKVKGNLTATTFDATYSSKHYRGTLTLRRP